MDIFFHMLIENWFLSTVLPVFEHAEFWSYIKDHFFCVLYKVPVN